MAAASTDAMAKMYADGASLPMLSREFELPLSTVRCRLLRAGVQLRSKLEASRTAAANGRLGSGGRGKKRVFTPEWRQSIREARIRHGDRCAKGVRTTSNGYLEYTRGKHKGRLVHVVVMETHIGRALAPGECVHHIDENKLNNDIRNLQLMTRSSHQSHHAAENVKNRERDSLGRFK